MRTERAANMPKDNIERAIKRASGDGGSEAFEEIRYEGYGTGGVAVIVETLTDNRNRTAAEVRSAFTKFGGTLGETNSVSFQFNRVGLIRYAKAAASDEAMLEAAIESGADDCVSGVGVHEALCAPDAFNDVRDALEALLGVSESASLVWQPMSTVPIDEKQAESLFKMFEALGDSDDVQHVSSNFEVSDVILDKLSA
jgi:YebC/PmpR family DNA-binding regulatory protein